MRLSHFVHPRHLARLLVLVSLATCGCASIPPGEQAPAELPGAGEPLPLRLALTELSVSLGVEESAKASVGPTNDEEKYELEGVIDYAAARRDLSEWLSAGGSFARVRVAEGESVAARRVDAWSARDDLLLEVELREFRTHFDGHNWLWIPNVLNWAYWIVPAWFVATEEYSLELTATARVRGLTGANAILELDVPVRVEGTFGDFQRGWQFFGPIYPNNGPENWRAIALALWPAARAALGRGLALALRGRREELARALEARELTKSLVLSVGISNYEDTLRLPLLPRALSDAQALSAAWTRAGGLLPGQALDRYEAKATLDGVEAAFEELRDRARPGDLVVVHFAGYGTRDVAGAPALILNGPSGGTQLSFARLAQLLRPISGEKLLILDCGFDSGQARTVAGGAAPGGDELDGEVQALAVASASAVLTASGPGGALLVPGHLGQSLFAHYLVEGLGGPADRDQDSVLSFAELSDYVRRKVTAESAFLGERPQRPRAAGGEGLRIELRREAK